MTLLKKIAKERGKGVIIKHILLTPLVEIVLRILLYSPLKIGFLNLLGARISSKAILYNFNIINYDIGSIKNLRIGKHVHIEPGVTIDVSSRITIGEGTSLSPGGMVLTHSKAGNILEKIYPPTLNPIHIGKNSWIGANAIIMANVGSETVIGAGSVVNKPIPDKTVAVGSPAKVIKKLK